MHYIFRILAVCYLSLAGVSAVNALDGHKGPTPAAIKAILDSQEGIWLGTEMLKNRETGVWRIGNPINLTITRVGELSDHHRYGEDFAFTRHYRAPLWVFTVKNEEGKEVSLGEEPITEFSAPDMLGHWRYVTKYTSSPLEGPVVDKMEIAEFSYGTYHKRYFSKPVGSKAPYELYGEFMGRKMEAKTGLR